MNRLSLTARVVAAVAAFWLLVAVVWGAQTSLGASLQGNPVPMASALQTSLIQSLPWIPVTLAVVWMAVRFPVTRSTWKWNLWVHVLAVPLVAFAANVLVVLGFWISSGSYQGVVALARGGVFWATMRIHIALLIYAAIAAATQAVGYYRATRARELRVARLEGQLARARLQALNAQIRPHFLFNTLHTIGQLWRSGRSDEADAMLDHLGSLFQTVQSTARLAEVPLDDELAMVRQYLAIEEARFQDRLTARVDADSDTLDCRVPPLILQPLVENAIRHGISADSSAGHVTVRARTVAGPGRGPRLALEVQDDGPGMDAPSAATGSGTGLANTRERLAQLYGDDARFEVLVPDGGGTLVRIELPAHRG